MTIPLAVVVFAAMVAFLFYLLIMKWPELLETGEIQTWADVAAGFVAVIAFMIYILAATGALQEITIAWLP